MKAGNQSAACFATQVARVENVALARIPGPIIIAQLDGASGTAMVLAIDTVRSTFR
jgi:hypothetical protein